MVCPVPSLDSTLNVLHVFGDATRVRLMALLAGDELSVAELVSITEVPQSRVSTHLGRLKDAGLLRDRRVGASTLYAVNDAAMPAEARRVWELVSSSLDDRVLEADRRRALALKRARAGASWPDSIAGEMERHYSPGRTWEATARGVLGFIRLGDALDVGAGDGVIANLLAARAASYTCLDKSPRMIEAARRRLAGRANVRFELGDMHELPFEGQSFDQVLLFHTLTYSERPERALKEAARVLRPGGALALVTLAAHAELPTTAAYGHVQAGFSAAGLRTQLEKAGFSVDECSVTSREKRKPFFEVLSVFAHVPSRPENGAPNGRSRRRGRTPD